MAEKMKINRNNYEAYFLDYYEENLDPTGVAELMIFLEANPDLKPEFEEFEILLLSPDPEVVFEQKDKLKKDVLIPAFPVNAANYAEYLVASVENMLGPEEETALAKFIELNPVVAKELALYRLTVLKPDTSVTFKAKASLKREIAAPVVRFRPSRPLLAFLSVAASLTILVFVYLALQRAPDRQKFAQDRPAVQTDNSEIEPTVKDKTREELSIPQNTAVTDNVIAESRKDLNSNRSSGQDVLREARPTQAAASMAAIPALSQASVMSERVTSPGIPNEQRYEFSQLYTYYMIRNQMEYAQNLEDQKSRSLLTRTFNTVRQGVFGEDEFNPNAGEEKTLGWAMADLGVRGFNALTSSDIRLIRRMNTEGKTQSYAIRSDRAEYSRSVDK